MKLHQLIILLAFLSSAMFYGQPSAVSCNCPQNDYLKTKTDTIFQLSNGKMIALCGYINPDTKPVTLRWTPVIPCPNPDAGLVYIIRIYEVNKVQQPGQAVKSNTPVFEKQIKDTQAVWQVPSEYASSKKNITFVWNVQATNKEGKGYGMNNGVSENFNFKITDKITNNREK